MIPFDCERCLLHAEISSRVPLKERWPKDWYPQRLSTGQDVWWCGSCLKEVAAGSPEKL
jgi:hypothetical protein